jgi:hypothetical protein
MSFITNRIRVFLFGIVIAVMGLYNPGMALKAALNALDIYEE